MHELMKSAVRCSNCGKYKSDRTDYRAPMTAADDPLKPVCDDCKQLPSMKALRSLDIPVTAFRSDGTEEQTTMFKALRLDKLAKQEAADAEAAKSDAIWSEVGRLAKAWTAQLDEDQDRFRKSQRIVNMVKAEQARRNIAKSKAKTEKSRRKIAKLERQTALAKAQTAERMDLLRKAQANQAEMTARVEAFTADARIRIDAMMKRLEAGQQQVRISQERQAIADLARRDQEQADWQYRASLQTDPILRQAYLNKAQGITDDDD